MSEAAHADDRLSLLRRELSRSQLRESPVMAERKPQLKGLQKDKRGLAALQSSVKSQLGTWEASRFQDSSFQEKEWSAEERLQIKLKNHSHNSLASSMISTESHAQRKNGAENHRLCLPERIWAKNARMIMLPVGLKQKRCVPSLELMFGRLNSSFLPSPEVIEINQDLEAETGLDSPLLGRKEKERITSNLAGNRLMAYCAFTHTGARKSENEDRVQLFVMDKQEKDPKLPDPAGYQFEFIGLFDGHAGDMASEYAKQNLHKKILENLGKYPKKDRKQLLFDSVKEFDTQMNAYLGHPSREDKSGTTAVCLVSLEGKLFVLSVGDSQALVDKQVFVSNDLQAGLFLTDKSQGLAKYDAAIDERPVYKLEHVVPVHRPENQAETERITKAGGSVYRNSARRVHSRMNTIGFNNGLAKLGAQRLPQQPLRIFPSHLSLSRALGDMDIKRLYPKLIISDPEVHQLDLEQDNFDFIILGTDGVFDYLPVHQLQSIVYQELESRAFSSIKHLLEVITCRVFQELIKVQCGDNMSFVIVVSNGILDRAQVKRTFL